jgi:hypothetical protein
MRNDKFARRTENLALSAMALATTLFAVGCGDTEIKTYRVAKEDNQPPVVHNHTGAPVAERPTLPHLHSEVPEGWRELPPEKMRVASYTISGEDGQAARVSVTPLPGVSNMELESVNMWREEVGLKPLTSEQLKEQAKEVQVGDTKGIMVDLAPEATEGNPNSVRTIGALANREGIVWFIKLTGSSSLVGQQKENFTAYLKSLEFHSEGHGQPSVAAATQEPVSSNTEKLPAKSEPPNFKVPENWSEKPPGPMVTSAYAIKGDGAAEVTVSKFPGETGGMVANINRWRDQLGLSALSDPEARKSAEMLEVGGKNDSYLVDIKGTNKRTGKAARMVAVGVPYEGQTWFFKLLGDEALVEKEKDTFIRFIVSAY